MGKFFIAKKAHSKVKKNLWINRKKVKNENVENV
jgi:hypothetical protein